MLDDFATRYTLQGSFAMLRISILIDLSYVTGSSLKPSRISDAVFTLLLMRHLKRKHLLRQTGSGFFGTKDCYCSFLLRCLFLFLPCFKGYCCRSYLLMFQPPLLLHGAEAMYLEETCTCVRRGTTLIRYTCLFLLGLIARSCFPSYA
jgi:hypothetical protein